MQAGPAARVGYREEVHHPALAQPEVASGTMSMTADGRLVRDQRRPEREISEIGESFVSVRQGPDAPENLLPVPSELKPMLDAIRGVVGGDAEAIAAAFDLELVASAPLWRVRLVPSDSAARGIELVVAGCGARLRGMEVRQPGGVRRVIRFESQP
ncbi:MAG TPA: hypothetical protein VMM59_11470 [Thermohalobaculum sp.]|nr:hypothetical protein [Thermohalobaculum sp.]